VDKYRKGVKIMGKKEILSRSRKLQQSTDGTFLVSLDKSRLLAAGYKKGDEIDVRIVKVED
jgi:hypothetical protein